MSPLDRFRHALGFLTVLPAGVKAAPELYASAPLFPLVGVCVGALSGGVFVLASLIWSGLLPALLAVMASLILTGALHEDGLADTADGFGGGWTREQRLTIMKDSRLGAYGVLALGLGFALRVCALAALSPGMGLLALIAVHAGARCAIVVALAAQDYAGDAATARNAYRPGRLAMAEARPAFLWTMAAFFPILVARPGVALLGMLLGAALSAALALYSKRAIGGYCGDVLGAIEQLFEIGCLLGLAA